MHIPARHFAFVILSWFLLCAPALAQQVDNLKKNLSTGNINTGFDLPSGQTIRIESGATIIADAGSTVTGFGSAGAWGTITGTLSAQTDLNTALGLKANTADLGTLATLSAIASAQITDGTIVNADISTSAAIALSKLADSGTFALGATGQIAFETTALILSSAGITAEGDITANTLGGNGASITALNASNISSGSLALARIAQSGATSGQALAWNGSAWAPSTISSGLTIGTTTITSGTTGRLLYNNGGVVGEQALGTGVATFLGTPTLANLNTVVSDADVATTGANTLTGAQNITDSTAALSTTTGALKVTGGISTQNNIYAVNFITLTGGIRAGNAYINTSGNVVELYDNSYLIKLGVDSGGVHLSREADRTLGVKNGSSPASIRVFETDSGANDEYLEISAASGTNTIKPAATGTGTASAVRYYTTTTVWFGSGSGSPEGVETAGVGSVYTNTSNGDLYRKTSGSGNTGWTTP